MVLLWNINRISDNYGVLTANSLDGEYFTDKSVSELAIHRYGSTHVDTVSQNREKMECPKENTVFQMENRNM